MKKEKIRYHSRWLSIVRAYYIGIDEAGRGPLIGDMVVAGVMGTPSIFEKLALLGVKDSKLLSPSERLRFYKTIIESGVFTVLIYIPPHLLDKENLNSLEEKAIIKILNILSHIVNREASEIHIFIDEVKGCSKNIEKTLRNIFKQHVYFTMEPHADTKYTAVAAASIIAKVSRDLNLIVLRRVFGDFGSGYITDPDTKNWVLEYYSSHITPPLFIRRSWRVLRKIAPLWYITKKRKISDRSLLEYTKK
jgi:ribonuclease HII